MDEKVKKVFDVEAAYKNYLQKVNLTEDRMSPVQKIEMRRSFMAGAVSLFMMFVDELQEIEDEDLVNEIVNYMDDQIGSYWEAECKREEERNNEIRRIMGSN